jgi:hypothetical protein
MYGDGVNDGGTGPGAGSGSYNNGGYGYDSGVRDGVHNSSSEELAYMAGSGNDPYAGQGGGSGGGGGGKNKGEDVHSSIPEWAIPYLKKVGDEGVSLYDSGALGRVAGTNRNLDRTFGSHSDYIDEQTRRAISNLTGSQDRLTSMAQSGGYDTRALKDRAILQAQMETAKLGQQYGAAGTLGSARQAVQQGAQNAATTAEFANIDYEAAQRNFQNKMAAEEGLGRASSGSLDASLSGAEALGSIGMAERGIEQEQLDSPWQALERYSSAVYGNPARNVQKQEKGGK